MTPKLLYLKNKGDPMNPDKGTSLSKKMERGTYFVCKKIPSTVSWEACQCTKKGGGCPSQDDLRNHGEQPGS